MSGDRPIFVVGCPRSGTTMLSLMIHAHPRLAMPPESRFLLRVWRRRDRFGDLSTPAQRRALARACTNRKSRIEHLGLDRKQTRARILAAPPTLGSAFGAVFAAYAEAHGKARWGDKRPAYYAEVDLLLRLFPDAQIVHILRDGRANVASLSTMPWWPTDSVGSMATWAMAEYCARRDQRRLPADAFHLVRYESLVADPRPVLEQLCAFLGEDFDEAMLAPQQVADVVPARKYWHRNVRGDVSTARVQSWQRELAPWEIGLMETVLGRTLRRHGYALSGAGPRPTPRLVAQYAREALVRRAALHRRWLLEAAEARRTLLPLAAELTSAQRVLASSRAGSRRADRGPAPSTDR